jgi:drug/metabolite transporter (DMT)-like permease
MSWFYLALLAPLLYAVVNLLDDNLLQFVYKSPYLATASVGFFGSLPLLSRFFINAHAIPGSLAVLSFTAGFLTLAYFFFYFKGLGSDSPSIVIALFGLAPATIPFFAHFIVHEQLTSIEIVGFVIVLLASLGLSVTDIKKFKFSKALIYVAIAVVFMDIVSISTKYVYQRVDFYPAYLYLSAGMGVGGIFFLIINLTENKTVIRQISRTVKKLLPVIIVTELLGIAAELTLNLAISRGPVSLVKVIEGIQPMFVLLIALGLHPFWPKYFREAKEGQLVRKFALMLIIIIGLGVISVGAKI